MAIGTLGSAAGSRCRFSCVAAHAVRLAALTGASYVFYHVAVSSSWG